MNFFINILGVKMVIEPLIKQVICMKNMDRFSVTEIRAAFIALSNDEELDKRKLRQFIYDELNKLVKKGLLSKSTSENGKESRFKKSPNFHPSLLIVQSDNSGVLDVTNKIRVQLSELNADLLETMGALDTFINMRQQYPNVASELTEPIRSAREQKHILKGKIAAKEEILKKLKEKK